MPPMISDCEERHGSFSKCGCIGIDFAQVVPIVDSGKHRLSSVYLCRFHQKFKTCRTLNHPVDPGTTQVLRDSFGVFAFDLAFEARSK